MPISKTGKGGAHKEEKPNSGSPQEEREGKKVPTKLAKKVQEEKEGSPGKEKETNNPTICWENKRQTETVRPSTRPARVEHTRRKSNAGRPPRGAATNPPIRMAKAEHAPPPEEWEG